MEPIPRGEEERWDRARTRQAFARLAAARKKKAANALTLRDELVVAHLNLVRYLAGLQARPAYRRAVERGGPYVFARSKS